MFYFYTIIACIDLHSTTCILKLVVLHERIITGALYFRCLWRLRRSVIPLQMRCDFFVSSKYISSETPSARLSSLNMLIGFSMLSTCGGLVVAASRELLHVTTSRLSNVSSKRALISFWLWKIVQETQLLKPASQLASYPSCFACTAICRYPNVFSWTCHCNMFCPTNFPRTTLNSFLIVFDAAAGPTTIRLPSSSPTSSDDFWSMLAWNHRAPGIAWILTMTTMKTLFSTAIWAPLSRNSIPLICQLTVFLLPFVPMWPDFWWSAWSLGWSVTPAKHVCFLRTFVTLIPVTVLFWVWRTMAVSFFLLNQLWDSWK